MFKEYIAWLSYMKKISIALLVLILQGSDNLGDLEHILCSYHTWRHKQIKDSMSDFTF